jgi:hypothetical protein
LGWGSSLLALSAVAPQRRADCRRGEKQNSKETSGVLDHRIAPIESYAHSVQANGLRAANPHYKTVRNGSLHYYKEIRGRERSFHSRP